MDSLCEQNQQPNVLLVTLQAQGHINPLLQLGKCLVSKGLHVTLAILTNAPTNSSSALNSIGSVHIEFFSDGVHMDRSRRVDMDYYMDSLGKFAPANLLAFIRSHRRKFACIITSPFLPWVTDVAEEVDVPNAMLWIQACALYQLYRCYYNQLDEFPTESNTNMSVKLPGLPVFSADELPSFVLPSNTVPSVDGILNTVFHSLHKVKWVLGNSFLELEKDVITSLNDAGCPFWPVGPLVPTTLLGKEDNDHDGYDIYKANSENDCIEWLNQQKRASLVYISFGTVLSVSVKEIESIAAGLKGINRPFLWVIRSLENQEFGFLEEIKEQGLVVSWSPQTKVLSHPSVGCFLSHCGWNSLLESIAAGVPVIGCPQWTDQPTNAKLVTDVWGVGVKLKMNSEGVVSGEEVGRCVEEVMSGPRSEEFRKNALQLKTVAHEVLADGGSSDNNIKMFVNEVISSCSSHSKQI
ncbi:putative UDP-glucuronosyl/UDP-glucosyltransferase, UDP-glycosyltransferase family [Helianthus debilis subsp. tardiflorus]